MNTGAMVMAMKYLLTKETRLAWLCFGGVQAASHPKSHPVERILRQHDSSNVSNQLQQEAQNGANSISHCFPPISNHALRNDKKAKENGKEEISPKRREIVEGRLSEAARLKGAHPAYYVIIAILVRVSCHAVRIGRVPGWL